MRIRSASGQTTRSTIPSMNRVRSVISRSATAPASPGQPLGSGFDAKRLVERGMEQRKRFTHVGRRKFVVKPF